MDLTEILIPQSRDYFTEKVLAFVQPVKCQKFCAVQESILSLSPWKKTKLHYRLSFGVGGMVRRNFPLLEFH